MVAVVAVVVEVVVVVAAGVGVVVVVGAGARVGVGVGAGVGVAVAFIHSFGRSCGSRTLAGIGSETKSGKLLCVVGRNRASVAGSQRMPSRGSSTCTYSRWVETALYVARRDRILAWAVLSE